MLEELVKHRFHSLLKGKLIKDDVKVFIKREPHKIKKVEENRFRLISAVSLVDAVVDRVAFGWLARNVLSTVGKTPLRIGFSLLDGNWREFRKRFLNTDVLCLDKSSWDWTVTEWLVEALELVVLQLAEGNNPEFVDVMRKRFKILFSDTIYRFEDGTRVQQKGVGIMKSGCYLTIILNSIGQLLMHYMASTEIGQDPELTCPEILGDDTIQSGVKDVEGYSAAFAKYGAIVKIESTDKIVFAGFQFDADRVVPAYYTKHLFKLTSCDFLEDTLISYQHLYAKSPAMLKFVRDCCRKTGKLSALLPRGKLDLYG